MQTQLVSTTSGAAIATASAPAVDTTTVSAPIAVTAPAKRTAKPSAKRSKPATAKAAKPVTRKPADAKPVSDNAARIVSAKAVSEYYNGASLPFKSAFDRFADLRTDKQPKKPSLRQAALLASMLAADTSGNIKRDGTFTRGAFMLPRSLFDRNAKPGDVLACQPETGCLSDMLGRVISYVSGPTSGKQQAAAIFRIDLQRARVEISGQLGGKLASAAIARLDVLAPAKPAKRQAA